jgi:CRISPR system Cascade subunit CasA
MNLLHDPWIPICRHDGTVERITPWQMTERHGTNPVVAVNAARADFDGALMQFLIGLLQTTTAIETEEQWEDLLYDPPSPERLQAQFASVAYAFSLDGDGPRFMQDLQLAEGNTWSVASLLIDIAGERGFFVKHGSIVGMCQCCVATALFNLQINAPKGGRGHLTSLRGGGPLTTLVMGDFRRIRGPLGVTLWRNVWLNVLEKNRFLLPCGNPEKQQPSDTFPWLAPTRSSEGGQGTTPEDVHPAQMYWGMPRRIRLDLENTRVGQCDVCGIQSHPLIMQYLTKNYGVNYSGPWLHPLTPHRFDKPGVPLPRRAQPGGVSYRHWLGLAIADEAGGRQPARVVDAFEKRNHELGMQVRLWVFGYDMDNMKARCWYESLMPLYQLDEVWQREFAKVVAQLVQAADTVRLYLVGALRDAWFESGDARRKSDIAFIGQAFWQNTEPDFYESLGAFVEALKTGKDEFTASSQVKQQWHSTLCHQARVLFDRWANSEAIAYENPRRIATAHNQLLKNLYGPKLREKVLELPKTLQRQGVHSDAIAVSSGQ